MPRPSRTAKTRLPGPSAVACLARRRKGVLGCKQQGELAELAFTYKAASLGLRVMKPYGDSAPYDLVVDNGHRLLRIQVKSASKAHRGVFEINAGRGRFVKHAYSGDEVDFLAAYIFPEDLWYLIPILAFTPRKTIRLSPRTRRFHHYREAWHLLTGFFCRPSRAWFCPDRNPRLTPWANFFRPSGPRAPPSRRLAQCQLLAPSY